MHFPAIYSMYLAKVQHFLSLRPNHGACLGKTKTGEILQIFSTIQLRRVNSNPVFPNILKYRDHQ